MRSKRPSRPAMPAPAWRCITPDGQKRLAKDAVMSGRWRMLAFMDPDDPNPMGPKPTAAELATKKKAYTEAKTSDHRGAEAVRPGRRDRQAADAGRGDRRREDRRGRRGGRWCRRIMDAAVKAGPALGMKQKRRDR